MILYFSATGNTRFVAEGLARELGDEALDLCARVRARDLRPIESETPFVVCAPTYVCEPPRFLVSYLREVGLEGSRELYLISTSGGYAGVSSLVGARLARAKGMRYLGFTEFVMPPNYIAGSRHQRADDETVERMIAEAGARLPEVAAAIRERRPLRSRHVWLAEAALEMPLSPLLGWMGHTTHGFHVTDACVSCGLCERVCPLGVVTLDEGRPRWSGHTCAHCMACIQNCPTEAIEYRSVTVGRRRYRLRDYVRGKA